MFSPRTRESIKIKTPTFFYFKKFYGDYYHQYRVGFDLKNVLQKNLQNTIIIDRVGFDK